ncbi:MAG: DUF1802 family protein [Cyanobacteria bacterium P01_A01_bin.116]
MTALTTALCLPSLDIDALLQGRTIVAISNSFQNPSHFLLCPVEVPLDEAQLATRYHTGFLNSLKPARLTAGLDAIKIHAWAKSKTCRIYSQQDDLAALSNLTAWSTDYLHQLTQTRHQLFVLFLQVHRFDQPIELMLNQLAEDKIGNYIQVDGTWSDQQALPILSNETFAQRQKQLIKLSHPNHSELEPLQTELVPLRENSLGAMSLDRDLRYLLGWSRSEETYLYDSDLAWIQQISQVGRSTSELDYRKLVRNSLLKLGFVNLVCDVVSDANLSDSNPARATNVVGFDVYGDDPYTLVGKCSADGSALIPQTLTSQFIHVGNTLLGRDLFESAVKILFVAGPLDHNTEQATRGNKMNIMRPETLQRLTELKAQHPGAIDLLKLKACLQSAPFGEDSDAKVNQFINGTLEQLRLRSALIQSVKTYLESTDQEAIGLDTVCSAYAMSSESNLPSLSMGEIHDLLMELSSPLAGYLGRKKADNSRDVFYFLRELCIEDDSFRAIAL